MAFPVEGILDDFNRADAGPPPSSSWATGVLGGSNGMRVASNQCAPPSGSGTGDGYWNVADTSSADCEVYCTVPVSNTDSNGFVILYARLVNIGAGTTDGYRARWRARVSNTNVVILQRVDNGVGTDLGTIVADYVAGDGLGLWVHGTTLDAYWKSGAGAWTSVGTRTDATYSATGKLGLGFDSVSTTDRLDDVGGGPFAGGPAAQDLDPPLVTNTSTLYAPSLSHLLAPTLVTNASAFFGPTITVGAATLSPPLLVNTSTFFGPSVSVGAMSLSAPLVTNTSTLYAPAVAYRVSAPLWTNASTLYAPTVTAGAVTLGLPLTVNTSSFFAATITGGAIIATGLHGLLGEGWGLGERQSRESTISESSILQALDAPTPNKDPAVAAASHQLTNITLAASVLQVKSGTPVRPTGLGYVACTPQEAPTAYASNAHRGGERFVAYRAITLETYRRQFYPGDHYHITDVDDYGNLTFAADAAGPYLGISETQVLLDASAWTVGPAQIMSVSEDVVQEPQAKPEPRTLNVEEYRRGDDQVSEVWTEDERQQVR